MFERRKERPLWDRAWSAAPTSTGLAGDFAEWANPARRAAWWSDWLFEVWFVWRDRIDPVDFLSAFAEWSDAEFDRYHRIDGPHLNFQHWLFPLGRKLPAAAYLAGLSEGDKSILPEHSMHDLIELHDRVKKQRIGRDYRDA